MIKPDFEKIIYKKIEFHHSPWLKVYDFLEKWEFHIVHNARLLKYPTGHILNFSNGHLSYIPRKRHDESALLNFRMRLDCQHGDLRRITMLLSVPS